MPDGTEFEETIDPRVDAEAWLEHDEAGSRPYRAKRLQVLLDTLTVTHDGFGLYGGMCSAQIFAEMRLAFLYGLFLSTVLLALSCIEQELAGILHAGGDDSAARARFETLIRQAWEVGILDEEQANTIDRLREIRNAYAHYRQFGHATSWISRALAEDKVVDEVLEGDAIKAMAVLNSVIARQMGYRV